MRDFLLSIGAAQWVLPAMLVWPMAAALLVRFGGRDMRLTDVHGSVWKSLIA